MNQLSGVELVRWLERQVALAWEIRDGYLAALSRPGWWTVQGQQMLDGVNENLAYFERELGEAKCLQLKS